MKAGLVALLLVGCAHAGPPRATTFGKKVGLGEVVGDREALGLLKEVLAENFELDGKNPQLHLHVDAAMSRYEEPVLQIGGDPGAQSRPRMFRNVVRMKATLRLVEDAGGAVLAEGRYEETEKGPDQPQGTQGADDLGVIVSRRIVKAFVEAHHF